MLPKLWSKSYSLAIKEGFEMHSIPWSEVLVKSVAAGLFVVVISVLSTMFRPKFFAGLFAGAPSVATVGLLLTGLNQPPKAASEARGMILGAVGLVASTVTAAVLLPRWGAFGACAGSWGVWGLVAGLLYLLVPG